MAVILLLEDDKALHQAILSSLKKDNHKIISAFNLKQGIAASEKNQIDLFLLDINLPDGNGIALCKKIRTRSNQPILFLTARNTEENMLEGFQAGCDDYIAKPFSLTVLRQKISAILRRTNKDAGRIFIYHDLEIHYDKMSVTLDGEEIRLTGTEYKLLSCLARNKGRVLTRSMLLEQIWDSDGNFIDENTLSVHVRRLRQKIEKGPEPEYIITIFGIGYTFGEE